MVFEGFHQDDTAASDTDVHAHASSPADANAGNVEYQDKFGNTASSAGLPHGTKLYSSASPYDQIGTYDSTTDDTNPTWVAPVAADPSAVPDAATVDEAFSLTELQTFDGLKGADLSKVSSNFGIVAELTNDLDGSTVDKFMYHTVYDFLDVTHKVKDAAEISAINNYVKSLQRDENARLSKLNDKFSNNVLTTKEMYMMVNRDAHQIRSNIRLVLYAMVFASVVMALMPYQQTTWAKVLIGLSILVFFTYTVLYIRKDRSRRFKDFSKYFFAKGDLSDKPTTESSGVLDDEESDPDSVQCESSA